MATKTEKYELRKKEENDFYNIEDFNDNMDKLETALTEFDDSGSADGITSFTEMITKFVTGNKLAVTLRNLKAGLQFVLHTGSIVNNCVTDNPKLPLSAAQGKVLMDYFNQLNSNLSNLIQRDIVKVTLAQGEHNSIITVQRDIDIWKPFLITDGEGGTFNAVTNFWKIDNVGKIALYSQSGVVDRNISIWYIKAAN